MKAMAPSQPWLILEDQGCSLGWEVEKYTRRPFHIIAMMFLEPQEVGDRGTLLMKMSLEAFTDGDLDLFSQISLTFFHNYFF